MTRVRLPDTPVPPPSSAAPQPEGTVAGLFGLLVCRDDPGIAARVRVLQGRCQQVVVVDDGSRDETARVAGEAGARVLRLDAPRGEGAALREGMRLARELGAIGALCPGREPLDPGAVERLALAHARAPEALLLGVGPGQAIAGQEWDEALALAEGRTPEPRKEWRPSPAGGLAGVAERSLERLVRTRFAYPWGGPRVLPLQAILRRDLRETGPGIHIELLAASAVAGIPAIEIELELEPARPVVSDRRVALRLVARFLPCVLKDRVAEKLGIGGSYAPPTTSPLGLLLGASLALLLILGASGCPKPAPPPSPAACEQEMPRESWPGSGDAGAALQEVILARGGFQTLWVEQSVEIDDPGLDGPRKMRGILALGGPGRMRLRLLVPTGAMTIFDYVQVDGSWQLAVPAAGILSRGGPADPVMPPEGMEEGMPPLRPAVLASLIRSVQPGAEVRWQAGSCAVLEELAAGAVVRRLAFRQAEGLWLVAGEEVLDGGEVALAMRFDDYRPAGEAGIWPHKAEITDPARGSRITLLTRSLRTDGVTDAFFVMQE